jgi:hypothetical protein
MVIIQSFPNECLTVLQRPFRRVAAGSDAMVVARQLRLGAIQSVVVEKIEKYSFEGEGNENELAAFTKSLAELEDRVRVEGDIEVISSAQSRLLGEDVPGGDEERQQVERTEDIKSGDEQARTKERSYAAEPVVRLMDEGLGKFVIMKRPHQNPSDPGETRVIYLFFYLSVFSADCFSCRFDSLSTLSAFPSMTQRSQRDSDQPARSPSACHALHL